MIYQEFTGKTVEEAVENGLKELGLTAEQADIRVLEEGKKKLFGSVKARVEIAAKEAPVEVAETKTVSNECGENATDGERTVVFLEGLFELLNITACTELVSEGDKVEINVTAANTTSIIGKHGAMLDAIQTLAGAVANTGRDDYKRVVVDCENYRENREATLNKLSENLAQKAIRLGKKIMLEPNRYIVIVPNNLEDPDAPAIAARNDRDRRGNNNRGGYNRGGKGGKFNDRGRSGGYNKKPYNRDRKPAGGNGGGTSLKGSNDFFGIFLGNSNNEDK